MAAVNVALPSIAENLSASAQLISWIPTAFLLSNVAFMLPCSKLADNIGRKRVYIAGLLIVCLASTFAALTPSIEWLLFSRLIQGIGSAMIFGCGMAIITSVFPPNKRGLPLGLNSFCIYLGLALAPMVGGWCTEHLGWRSVFWLQIPASLAVIAIMISQKGEWTNPSQGRYDWKGTVLFGGWAFTFTVGLSGLPNMQYLIGMMLGLILLVWFIRHEADTENPLIRVGMFRESRVFSFSLIAAFLMYAAGYPVAFIVSLYLQYILAMSPIEAGQIMLLQAVAMMILAPFAGKLSDRWDSRWLATSGCAAATIGFFLLTLMNEKSGNTQIALAMILLGIGYGLFTTPNNNTVMSAVVQKEIGSAAASVNLARVSGNLISMGVVTMIVHWLMGDNLITPTQHSELEAATKISLSIATIWALSAGLFSALRGKTL
ncbi:MFS transporter [Marinibactrum halimedae]|uniref:MFS transporter n=2 Tax=Marinibactrum halimedae TaxID=1444977 RepID=A0AA37T8N6_9GAMM|nr:MFS transporter [Marinibactrum halimedae]